MGLDLRTVSHYICKQLACFVLPGLYHQSLIDERDMIVILSRIALMAFGPETTLTHNKARTIYNRVYYISAHILQ